ncbi:MAG: PAS domain-containing protein, partial [Terricaulis sp.]
MNRITPRQRLDRLPAAAWAAGALGALAALFAFGTNAAAAVLMVLAAAAAYWAMREGKRFDITSSADQIELVGLAELAPLLEALPDPALLVDSESRVVGSNAAARRQMHFEARGQFLTSILRHPDVLEA